MKKISLFVCIVLLSYAGLAQRSNLGIKGGLNISNITVNGNTDWGSKLGGHAGLLAHIHLVPSLALQPELVFSNQGAKYTITDGEHTLNLNYINLPVLLQYMFNNGFRIQTGPQLGFLAGVKDKVNDTETNFFTTEDFETVDVSWAAGLGYLSQTGLGVDARYNFGLNNINNVGTNKLRNNVFQVGVFYMFNNNHKRTSR